MICYTKILSGFRLYNYKLIRKISTMYAGRKELHETKESHCPVCGQLADIVMDANGAENSVPPSPNDITICIACHSVLTFTDDMEQVVLTKEKFNELESEVQNEIVMAVEWSKRYAEFKKMLKDAEDRTNKEPSEDD